MKKTFMLMMIVVGLVALTGCNNYGSSASAKKAAYKFVDQHVDRVRIFGNRDGLTLTNVKTSYDDAEKKWDITGIANYQSSIDFQFEEQNFEVVESTKDNKMWTCDSINIEQ